MNGSDLTLVSRSRHARLVVLGVALATEAPLHRFCVRLKLCRSLFFLGIFDGGLFPLGQLLVSILE